MADNLARNLPPDNDHESPDRLTEDAPVGFQPEVIEGGGEGAPEGSPRPNLTPIDGGIPNPLDTKGVLDSINNKRGNQGSKGGRLRDLAEDKLGGSGKDLDGNELGGESSFFIPRPSAKGLEAGASGKLGGLGQGAASAGELESLGVAGKAVAATPEGRAAVVAAGLIKHKKKILVGILLSALMIIFIVMTLIFQGPLQFLHIGALLERFHLPFIEDQGAARLAKVYSNINDPNLSEERRMGTLAKALSEQFSSEGSQSGATLNYDDNGRLSSVTLSAESDEAVQTFQRQMGNLGEVTNGEYQIDNLQSDPLRLRKAVRAYSTLTSLDVEKVTALERRHLIGKVDASFKWLDNIEGETDEELREAYIADRDQKITQGKTNDSTLAVEGTEEEGQLDLVDVNEQSEEEARQQTIDGGGTGLFGGICRASQVGQDIELQNDLVWTPAMRTSSKLLSLRSQIMANSNVSNRELALESQYFDTDEMVYQGATATDSNGNLSKGQVNWTASAQLRTHLNETGGEEIDADIIPYVSSREESPNAVLAFVERLPFSEQVCNLSDNGGITGVIFGVIDQIASSILVNTLPSNTLEPFIDIAARGNIGNPTKYYTKGPKLFEEAMNGTLYNINEVSWTSGGLPIPADAEEQINTRVAAEELKERSHTPLLARLFDIKDPTSLVAQAVIRVNYSENPVRYSQRALAAITPEQIGRTVSQPVYAATTDTTSVQNKYYGVWRVGWTEEEIAHSQAVLANNANAPSKYESYIFRNGDFGFYREYSDILAKECYGMSIKENGSVVAVAKNDVHPESESRKIYCQGAAETVREAINERIASLNDLLQQIAEDNGWSSSEISSGQNEAGTTICNINADAQKACAQIDVLNGVLGEMSPGSNCQNGVFYLPYEHTLHNARADFDESDNFPRTGDCFSLPGEKLHQNARIYLSMMSGLQSAACVAGVDGQACNDTGVGQGSQTSKTGPGGSVAGNLPGGAPQELAKKIMDSGNVTGNGNYIKQIQDYANGDFSCNLSPTILGLLSLISESHTIYITSLNRFCTGVLTASGTGSYHYAGGGGHAVDIGIVDGVSSTGATANDLTLLNEVVPLLPFDSGVGQSNCRSQPLATPDGIRQFKDSCNHIHIEVPLQ